MQKIRLYIDETGLDTDGELFIVAAVVVSADTTDQLHQYCEALEQSSGKGKFKWAKRKPNCG